MTGTRQILQEFERWCARRDFSAGAAEKASRIHILLRTLADAEDGGTPCAGVRANAAREIAAFAAALRVHKGA